ncbi:hypothetical protein [Gudongella sp. SC589]|uniref:hypothetical protein n=1 Tax=Gudongella sp. SC589 TaxID=3385990 RepID=UPI003904853F
MKIEIQSAEGKIMSFPIPEFLADNPISLRVAASKISEHSPLSITAGDLKSSLGTIKDYKREHGGDLLLVDVESSDGEKVRIWI